MSAVIIKFPTRRVERDTWATPEEDHGNAAVGLAHALYLSLALYTLVFVIVCWLGVR